MPPKKIADAALEGSTDQAKMMAAEQVLLVSAPGGPRRRAGLAFDKEPVELTEADLGDDPVATYEALRADPKLKIDASWREIPIESDGEQA